LKIAKGGHSLQPAWAFATAGLFLAVLANVEPILTFDVAGDVQTNHIVTGAMELVRQGYWPVALLVCFAGIVAPFLHLGSVWYVTSACSLRARWPLLPTAVKFVEIIEPWNLVPVYMVGTIVAVVKLKMLGAVYWQQGALWILALSLCSLLTMQVFDRELVEERLEAMK
jgi:paraquat-inducible protein A